MLRKFLLFPALAAGMQAGAQQQDHSVGLHYPLQQGSIIAGGNIQVAQLGIGSGGTYYNGGIEPGAAYLLTDHLAAGITLNAHASGTGAFHAHTLGGGLFARYYLGKAVRKDGTVRKARFFAEAGISYATGAASFEQPDGSWRRWQLNRLTPNVMAGVNYFLTRNIAFEGGVYYQYNHYIRYGGTSLGSLNQAGVKLGIKFLIGR